MNKLKTILILALTVALLAVSTTWFIAAQLESRTERSVVGVMEKIKSISELNTVEMYFSEVIDFKNAKYFRDLEIPFTQKSFLFTVKAKVKAGVDLMKLSEKDVTIDKTTIKLVLPKPEITSKEILEYKAYDENDGLFNEVTNEDTLQALQAFQDDLQKQAIENGILKEAEKRTTLALQNLLMVLGFDQVEIEYK